MSRNGQNKIAVEKSQVTRVGATDAWSPYSHRLLNEMKIASVTTRRNLRVLECLGDFGASA